MDTRKPGVPQNFICCSKRSTRISEGFRGVKKKYEIILRFEFFTYTLVKQNEKCVYERLTLHNLFKLLINKFIYLHISAVGSDSF